MYSKIEHKFACECQNNNNCKFDNSEMDTKYSKKDFIHSHINLTKMKDVEREEILAIRNRFPTKVPVIVRRYNRERRLPQLDKSKYLVPQEITMSQFQTIIRNRIHMHPNQALYLLINERSMLSLSLTLAEAYREYALPDGYLYVTYASQEVFGGESELENENCTKEESKIEKQTEG